MLVTGCNGMHSHIVQCLNTEKGNVYQFNAVLFKIAILNKSNIDNYPFIHVIRIHKDGKNVKNHVLLNHNSFYL